MFRLFRIGQQFFDGDGLGGSGGGSDGGSEIGSSTASVDSGAGTSVIETAVAEARSAGTLEGAGEGKPPAKVETKTDAEVAEEAEIAKIQAELKAKNPKLAGRIDVDRHQAVLTRQRNQAKAEFDAAVEKHQAELKDIEWAKDPEARAAVEALSLADSDPEKFIGLLLNDPRYQGLITLKQKQELQAAVEGHSGGEGRPEPDQTTPDGSMKYYSHEGLQTLMAWERKEAAREAKDAIDKEYGPLKQEFQQRNQWNSAVVNAKKTLEGARRDWAGFAEHEAAIGKALAADAKLELHDAYRQVVFKALSDKANTSEAEMRKRIMAEMNKKPAAATSDKPGTGQERADSKGEKSGEDVIRAALRAEGLM